MAGSKNTEKKTDRAQELQHHRLSLVNYILFEVFCNVSLLIQNVHIHMGPVCRIGCHLPEHARCKHLTTSSPSVPVGEPTVAVKLTLPSCSILLFYS